MTVVVVSGAGCEFGKRPDVGKYWSLCVIGACVLLYSLIREWVGRWVGGPLPEG
jgi:hypothetical protein